MAIKAPFLRTPYNYDVDEAALASSIVCLEPSRTAQEFRDECDINTILKRFGITGELPQGLVAPTFGDFTGVDDYQSALNAVLNAKDDFMMLPADIRKHFDNNPQQFVAFCSDPANAEQAKAWGLITPFEVPEPEVFNVRVVPENNA